MAFVLQKVSLWSRLFLVFSHGLESMESQRDDTELASLSRPCTGPGVLCTVLFPESIPWTVSLVCTHFSPKDGLGVIVCKDNRCSLGRTGVSTYARVKLLNCERKFGRELVKKRCRWSWGWGQLSQCSKFWLKTTRSSRILTLNPTI